MLHGYHMAGKSKGQNHVSTCSLNSSLSFADDSATMAVIGELVKTLSHLKKGTMQLFTNCYMCNASVHMFVSVYDLLLCSYALLGAPWCAPRMHLHLGYQSLLINVACMEGSFLLGLGRFCS